jgi:hypothetical protein
LLRSSREDGNHAAGIKERKPLDVLHLLRKPEEKGPTNFVVQETIILKTILKTNFLCCGFIWLMIRYSESFFVNMVMDFKGLHKIQNIS